MTFIMILSSDLPSFKREIRDFVRAQLPDDIRQAVRAGQQVSAPRLKAWFGILAAHGLLVPHWPERWGGRGWSVQQQLAFDEVMATNDAPEGNALTYDMIGPVLVRFGNPAQQQRHLSAIATGQTWWCQGFSEPNAGSDLSSLSTRARREGDAYRVNGSKIWTSSAQYSDWIFCLVRTDTQGDDGPPQGALHPLGGPAERQGRGPYRQQEGISFLLIDMKTPGITVRPIRGIHGWEVFNEVFLDDVMVPVENLVGEENKGWSIAKSLLEFERLKLARIGENKRRRQRLLRLAGERGADGRRIADAPWFRARFTELDVRLWALEANSARFVAQAKAGKPIGAEVSMLKLRGSQLIQLWEELTVDALGPRALALDPAVLDRESTATPPAGIAATASSRRFLSRGYTIAGGSSEVQHNVLAKQVLGL